MAKVDLYNLEGKVSGSIDLNDAIFAVPVKEDVVHQVYLAQMANARQPWAHSKDKSEVRGGGKKPWRQKGTGRARHGSIRSPLWKGGGVTFGPLNTRNYKQKINKKANKNAVRMCLSAKAADGKLIILDSLTTDGKTKGMAKLRAMLPGFGKTTIMLSGKADESLNRATRNIPRLDLQRALDVNVVDLLHHQYIIISKEGIEVLEKRLNK